VGMQSGRLVKLVNDVDDKSVVHGHINAGDTIRQGTQGMLASANDTCLCEQSDKPSL
jgi:hypothetical protein